MTEQTKVAISFSLIVGLGVAIICYVCYIAQYPPYKPIKASVEAVERQTTEISIETLLDAIEFVESGGDANAIGDGDRAVGAYQIWKIYVRDANRILGWDKYTYEDRWDRDKSREMTAIVIQHYGKGDIETMARSHKCPPERYKESTKKYWLKIKNYLVNMHFKI